MSTSIYDKPVRQLMHDMVRDIGLKQAQIFSKNDALVWFKQHYPKIQKGTVGAHLIRMSTNAPSRIHYGVKKGEDDLFFQMDGSHFRLYSAQSDPPPIYKDASAMTDGALHETVAEPEELPEDGDSAEFAYEHDLQNFLAKNLTRLEPGLVLYEDEGITGLEFPVGGRFVDILAVDARNNLVVIELKVSRGYDRVVGQALRYIGWIKHNLAGQNQGVRGIIVAREISEDLRLACSGLEDISLYEYELAVTLTRVK